MIELLAGKASPASASTRRRFGQLLLTSVPSVEKTRQSFAGVMVEIKTGGRGSAVFQVFEADTRHSDKNSNSLISLFAIISLRSQRLSVVEKALATQQLSPWLRRLPWLWLPLWPSQRPGAHPLQRLRWGESAEVDERLAA